MANNVLFGAPGGANEFGFGNGGDGFFNSGAAGGAGGAFGGAAGAFQPAAAPAGTAYQRHPGHGAAYGAMGSMGGASYGGSDEDYSADPPLLEELGVDFRHILHKVTAVLMLTKPIDRSVMHDADLAGPLVFCLVLGMCLLLSGKLHFGYIYGFGLLGCLAIYTVVNLMQGDPAAAAAAAAAGGAPAGVSGSVGAPVASLDFSLTFSMLGYCLLPIVLLAALAIFVSLRGTLGVVLGIAAIGWSTLSAARFFEAALGMSDRKWLIAYPAGLFYAVFALMAIF